MGARAFHERDSAQADVLRRLRSGERLTKMDWEHVHRNTGARLAPAISQLGLAYGFDIRGDGSVKNPHYLADRHQLPNRVKVTERIKKAYYDSEHWEARRQSRLERDGFRCVLCVASAGALHVHHVTYARLFTERLSDLMTVCEECHEIIHDAAKMKFPDGMMVGHIRELGFEPTWEDWLLPPTKPVPDNLFGWQEVL